MNDKIANLLDDYTAELRANLEEAGNDAVLIHLYLGTFVSRVQVCADMLREDEFDD